MNLRQYSLSNYEKFFIIVKVYNGTSRKYHYIKTYLDINKIVVGFVTIGKPSLFFMFRFIIFCSFLFYDVFFRILYKLCTDTPE